MTERLSIHVAALRRAVCTSITTVLAVAVLLAIVAPASAQSRVDDAYRPPATDTYRGDSRYGTPVPPPSGPSYGQPYTPAPAYADPSPRRADRGMAEDTYAEGEIVEKGRGFFGAVSQGLAGAIEHTFRRAGRPNGYILGEDGGAAIFAGLRYGKGVLYTKDAGDHEVYWQGPSLGYDLGGEGSKVMILAYNLSDPSDIYHRFGGVEGSAYVVGGVSVQFQKYGDMTLAVIRSGVGLRLGANVGYSKYTRRPTWNPF
jgi:hypothetical protein